MNPSSSNNLTRRSFVKQSTLTVGAAALISGGVGLAGDGATTAPCDGKCNRFTPDSPRKVYTWAVKPTPTSVVPGTCYVLGTCTCLGHGYGGHVTTKSTWKKEGDNSGAEEQDIPQGRDEHTVNAAGNGNHQVH